MKKERRKNNDDKKNKGTQVNYAKERRSVGQEIRKTICTVSAVDVKETAWENNKSKKMIYQKA